MAGEERFAALVEAMLEQTRRDVRIGRRGAAAGVRLDLAQDNGKIFAMLVKGRLVVKLDRKRVDELVAAGEGEPFDPGHGRIQKEWIALDPRVGRGLAGPGDRVRGVRRRTRPGR